VLSIIYYSFCVHVLDDLLMFSASGIVESDSVCSIDIMVL